jgi:hypothetical protein
LEKPLEVRMRAIFLVALLVGSMLITRPAQADIDIPLYTLSDHMKGRCLEELKQGRGGFCAGFVFATFEHLARVNEVCRPPWAADEDALRIAIQRLDKEPNANVAATMGAALREAWPPCKQ